MCTIWTSHDSNFSLTLDSKLQLNIFEHIIKMKCKSKPWCFTTFYHRTFFCSSRVIRLGHLSSLSKDEDATKLKRLWVGGGVVAGQMHCKYLTSSSYLWWSCFFSRQARTSRTNPSQSVSPWVSHTSHFWASVRVPGPWCSALDIWIFWPQACFIPTSKVHQTSVSSKQFLFGLCTLPYSRVAILTFSSLWSKSRLVLGWLHQVVMHLRKCHQPLLMYSFSILNKELTLKKIFWIVFFLKIKLRKKENIFFAFFFSECFYFHVLYFNGSMIFCSNSIKFLIF